MRHIVKPKPIEIEYWNVILYFYKYIQLTYTDFKHFIEIINQSKLL